MPFLPLTVSFAAAAPYLSLLALLLSLVALFYLFALRARFSKLMQGRNGSIEETIAVLSREVKDLKKFRAELEAYLKAAEVRLKGSIRGVGVVRYNPFKGEGAGGNQSFALAFLDEEGHGVVLSSLYARDRVGLYAKPLEKGVSSFELTDEEKQAIEQARQSAGAHKKKT